MLINLEKNNKEGAGDGRRVTSAFIRQTKRGILPSERDGREI
jgi:hypothetical protein